MGSFDEGEGEEEEDEEDEEEVEDVEDEDDVEDVEDVEEVEDAVPVSEAVVFGDSEEGKYFCKIATKSLKAALS